MKKLTLLFSLLIISMMVQAQTTFTACNSVTAPAVVSGPLYYGLPYYPIGANMWTGLPPMATTAVGLPNTEYLVIKKGLCAKDAGGNCDTTGNYLNLGPEAGYVIVGTDANGDFDPFSMNRYGISIQPGDTFGVVAVGYNLNQVKGLVNQILTGSILGTSPPSPCCAIFNLQSATLGFCDTLRGAGISSQYDVRGLSEVLTVFDAFASSELSVKSLLFYLSTVNSNTYSSLLNSAGCGNLTDNVLICYGIDADNVYWYKSVVNVSVESVERVAQISIYPNPTSEDINIRIESAQSQELTLNLYNGLGQRVYQSVLGNVQGTVTVQAPTSTLSAGIYMAEITNGKNSQTQKVIVR
jgi:hypothetical protein